MPTIDINDATETVNGAPDQVSFFDSFVRSAPYSNPLVIGFNAATDYVQERMSPRDVAITDQATGEHVVLPSNGSDSPTMMQGTNFNLFEQPEIQTQPGLARFFFDVDTREEFDQQLKRIADVAQIRRELEMATPFGSEASDAEMLNELFSPEVFVMGPGAAGIKSAMRLALLSAGGATVSEQLLASADPLRDPSLAPMAVGSAFVAGGVFGTLGKHTDIPLEAARETVQDMPRAKFSDFAADQAGEFRVPGTGRNSKNPGENPNVRPEHLETLRGEAPAPTGIGIERLPLNPTARIINSASNLASRTAEELVDMGGIIKNKNRRGLANAESIETAYRIRYQKELFDTIDAQNELFLKYRGRTAESPGRRMFAVQRTRLEDAFNKGGKLSAKEFRVEVGKAMRRGDKHDIPEVAQAARNYRQMVNRVGDDALQSGLFERAIRREIAGLEAQAAKVGKESAEQAARIQKLTQKLDKLKREGLDSNNADSFFPRVYRVDRILDDPEGFITDVARGLIDANPGMSVAAARKSANTVLNSVSGIRPHIDLDGINRKGAGDANSARARMLDIEDRFLEKWLESDAEIVLRSYNKSIATDTLIQERFGDVSMAGRIKEIEENFDIRIEAEKDLAKRRELQRDRDQTISDIQNLRDVVRGTFGASNDPFSATTKFVKAMKAANVVLFLGGAAVSSFSDLGRFAMTEGIKQGYGPLLKSLTSENGRILRQMAKEEVNLAGEALDMVLGIRALQMADIGSSFGRLSKVERVAQEGANVFFLANGLNYWNTVMKEWAGLVIGDRILKDVADIADNAATFRTKGNINEKLTRAGIDAKMAGRINSQFVRYGDEIDGVKVANTAAWDDLDAVNAYRAALSQDVNRTIVTPGAGDKAFWTSTEFGSLIAQFKSFAQASTNRVLVSGLQEADSNMAIGAGVLLGLGAGVAQIKALLAGRDQPDTLGEIVETAIDRSGLFGVFQEFNNVAEVMSGNRLGLGPLLTGQGPSPSPQTVAGTFFGPTGSAAARAGRVAGDVLSGNVDRNTAADAVGLVPGNNLPFVEPFKP